MALEDSLKELRTGEPKEMRRPHFDKVRVKCPYIRALKWDYTAGCITLGILIGFIIGYFYPKF
jgi:hypothetical protein